MKHVIALIKRFTAPLMALIVAVGALSVPAQAGTVNGITADTNLPNTQRGALYQFQIEPTGGGGAPYTFEVVGGAFPAGITMNSSGFIYGVTCASNGSYSIGIRITSATGTVADFVSNPNLFSLGVNAGPSGCDFQVLLGSLPPVGFTDTPYSGTVSASGGVEPYSFAIVSGALPPGLSLDAATGAVTGTPTAVGTYNFQVTATDSLGQTGSAAYTITILEGVTVNPATLPDGTFGQAYGPETVSATGGSGPPWTLALTAGALPDGLTFNAATG
ncbi:MAG: Ig domain-containing protein, partial [Steroidobacteraceae bacterium]